MTFIKCCCCSITLNISCIWVWPCSACFSCSATTAFFSSSSCCRTFLSTSLLSVRYYIDEQHSHPSIYCCYKGSKTILFHFYKLSGFKASVLHGTWIQLITEKFLLNIGSMLIRVISVFPMMQCGCGKIPVFRKYSHKS